MENKNYTVDEVFAEINKLNSEEKVVLSNNISLISAHLLMNDLEQYSKTLKTIDDTMDNLTKTKSVLKKLKSNMVTGKCQELIEKAKSFVPPEGTFIMPDVRADEFARMTNIIESITMKPIADCSRIVYDMLTRLSLIKNHHINKDSTVKDIVDSENVLNLNGIDLTETPCKLFAKLYDKRSTFSSLNLNAIAMSIAGTRNSEYSRVLIGNWEKFSNPISLGKVVESVYSLKETTEAMDRYFAEIKDKF